MNTEAGLSLVVLRGVAKSDLDSTSGLVKSCIMHLLCFSCIKLQGHLADLPIKTFAHHILDGTIKYLSYWEPSEEEE